MSDNKAIVASLVAGGVALAAIFGLNIDADTQKNLATGLVAAVSIGNAVLHHMTKGS